MRRNQKSSLTPLQQRSFVRIVLCLAVVAFLWVIFAPNMGIYSVIRKKTTQHKLESEVASLREQNKELEAKIDRIQHDVEYLEEVAREKYDLLKENEMVFDFSKNKNGKDKKK
jgi:cell division protein FtsB